MTMYIILFVFCILMFILNEKLKDEKIKKIIEITTLIVLCIISGTRYNVGGTDYYAYKNYYSIVPDLYSYDFDTISYKYNEIGKEKGYLFLNSLAKTLGFSYYGFTLIHSIIFYSCMYIGLKKYIKNFNFFILIFLYKLFFYNTFISMRQSISIAIFFLIFKYIQEKKPIKYWIGCLIAFAFHNSAIILFPVYFINKIKINKKKFAIIYIIASILLVLNIFSIFSINPQGILMKIFQGNEQAILRAEGYFEADETKINIIHTLEYFLIAILIYINYDKLMIQQSNNKYINSLINSFILLIFVFVIFRDFAIVTRIKDYFLFTYPILLYYLANINKKKYAIIIYSAAIIISFYGYCRYIEKFDSGDLKRYQTYINKDISIIENIE